MKKVVLGLIGLLLVVVMVSGCTSTAKKETVIFDKNMGGRNITTNQYVNVPSDSQIRVEISNVTTINGIMGPPKIEFFGLAQEGQNGQSITN
jgi:uncharacterized protein YcfL